MTLIPPGLKRQRKVNAGGLAEYWYIRATRQPILSAHGATELLLERDVKLKTAEACRLYWTGQATLKKGFKAGPQMIYDLITLYLKDPAFLRTRKGRGLRKPRTIHDRRMQFDIIRESRLAKMPLEALAETRKAAKTINSWRNDYAATPKKADGVMEALDELLDWAVRTGQPVEINPIKGAWTRLYIPQDHSLNIIPPEDVEIVCSYAGPDLQRAIRFAATSGVREGDLLELPWTAVKTRELRFIPSKGENKGRVVSLPTIPELQAVLDGMPKIEDWATRTWSPPLTRGETEKDRRTEAPWPILTRASEPWVRATLETQWKEARRQAIAAGHTQFKGKRWHDLRGTYGTRLARNPKLTIGDIAGIMGWDLKTAEKVIKFYVGNDVLNDALLDKIVTGEAEMAARLADQSEQNKT